MSEAIIVAIITGGLSLIGVIVSNNRTAQSMDKSMDAKLDKQQAVTETKLGLIRLGYGAAVKTLVLNLIDQAEREIQGTKRGAERKAWVVKMLRHYLDNSKWGKLVSWAITEETMSKIIQLFFDRARAALQKQ